MRPKSTLGGHGSAVLYTRTVDSSVRVELEAVRRVGVNVAAPVGAALLLVLLAREALALHLDQVRVRSRSPRADLTLLNAERAKKPGQEGQTGRGACAIKVQTKTAVKPATL